MASATVLRRTGTMEQTASEARDLLSNDALWRIPRETAGSAGAGAVASKKSKSKPKSSPVKTKKTRSVSPVKSSSSSSPKAKAAPKSRSKSPIKKSPPKKASIPKETKAAKTAASRVAKVAAARGPAAFVVPPPAAAFPVAPSVSDEERKKQLIASFCPPVNRGAPVVGVDVVFSFDTTGSMNSWLNTVRENLAEMIGQLLVDLPTIRIGILAHGDYCDKHIYITTRKDLSRDGDDIVNFVKTVKGTGGGDQPEAYEIALHKCLNKMSWNENHAKALVVIGDAYPHEANFKDNKKKIDWKAQVAGLAAKGVKIYAVQCGGDSTSTNFFQTMAAQTGGSHLLLKDLKLIKDMFMGVCYREGYEMELEQNKEKYENVLEDLQKEMESLGVEGGASKLLRPDESREAIMVSNDDMMRIHQAIHDLSDDVTVSGIIYPVTFGASGCRYVRINEHGLLFVQQNIERNTKFAQMAREGKKITWMCKKGQWGVIIDDAIDKKLE